MESYGKRKSVDEESNLVWIIHVDSQPVFVG
jgi:hypothetical protein